MVLRNSKGETVSAEDYKHEVLDVVGARLDRELLDYARVIRDDDHASTSGRIGRRARRDASSPRAPRVVVAADLLRADELAEQLMANLPVVESGNRLAELVGPCYDTGGVQVLLGRHRRAPVSKQAVEARRQRNSILAMQTSDGRWVYPVFQFQEGEVRPEVARLLAVFGDSPRWTMAAWFCTPAAELGDDTPVEWIEQGKPMDRLLALARDTAGRWAA